MINNWKRQLWDEASNLFEKGSEASHTNESQQSEIDEWSRQIGKVEGRTRFFSQQISTVGVEEVQRLMRQLGIEALYPKPRLSQAHPEHQVYPDRLRDLAVTQVNQVWCPDITYLPVLKGHFYLVAVMDWYSRKVLSWQSSNTLEVTFCVAALQEAMTCLWHT